MTAPTPTPSMKAGELPRELTKSVRAVRMQFIDQVEPFRDDLFKYCRSLTGSVWDAEDLVQETLLRTFAKLGEVHWDVARPRPYLFAVATNAWTDRKRRDEPASLPESWDETAPEVPARAEVREALLELAAALPPQERAALLLKDVFDFSLEDTARALRTTTGAVKAALHRGRARLGERSPLKQSKCLVSDALVDRFIDAFNARDLDRLTALFLEDATADVVGMVHEEGREQIRNGSLHHTLMEEAGNSRAERRVYRGETVIVLVYTKDGVTAVEDVLRFVERQGALESLRYYYFCPELLAFVARELGLPVRTNGHRYR
ncbi:MAG: sigma-70 family RNA polymerase sigma factor [Planctomycetota bacterium]